MFIFSIITIITTITTIIITIIITINFHLCVQILQSCKPIWDLNTKLLFTLYIV
jgi:hypothetical protein